MMMNYFKVFKEFMTYPSITGAIMPSSNRLSELITDLADLSDASSVIEFGPGTGVFTEKILQKKNKDANFIAIELNAEFVAATKKRCPNAAVYHDSALNARHYLSAHGLQHCDCIVCGLPWASFSRSLQWELLGTVVDILKPGGKFVTFAYLQGLLLPAGLSFRKKIQSGFRKVTTSSPVWMNAPPAFVYCAQK